ncbi:MAG: nucleotide exchange factor GrpE [Pirellulales bacterium]|nr:nucleotide exchange factor GrpE [Pirellulales bacterium]
MSEPTKTDDDADSAANEISDAERLAVELNEAKDRVLRAQAEVENVRWRARREIEEQSLYAQAPLMTDLLPVLDNVGRAIEAAEKHPDAAGLLEGFKMVARQLEDVLARHHCTPISALHEAFDPHKHQAILQQPSAEYPAGTVLLVAQPGYQLRDRVLRPTQVIVSSGEAS